MLDLELYYKWYFIDIVFHIIHMIIPLYQVYIISWVSILYAIPMNYELIRSLCICRQAIKKIKMVTVAHSHEFIFRKWQFSSFHTQPFIQAQISKNIKTPPHWPLYHTGDIFMSAYSTKLFIKVFHAFIRCIHKPLHPIKMEYWRSGVVEHTYYAQPLCCLKGRHVHRDKYH